MNGLTTVVATSRISLVSTQVETHRMSSQRVSGYDVMFLRLTKHYRIAQKDGMIQEFGHFHPEIVKILRYAFPRELLL